MKVIGIEEESKKIIEYIAKKEGISQTKVLCRLIKENFQRYLTSDSLPKPKIIEKIIEVPRIKIVYKIVEHEYRQPKLDARREEVKRLFVEEHWTPAKIAKKFGMSTRNVYRDLELMGVVRD